MAREYYKIFKDLKIETTVFGRGEASAVKFEKETGHKVITENISSYIKLDSVLPQIAVVAVGVESLAAATINLMELGIKKILVEKPAALDREELDLLVNSSKKYNAEVYVAYNRRFYASVIEAQKLAAQDGGISSIHYEFTEWSNQIAPLEKAPGVKEKWVLGNSSHVIDLAFLLGGEPKEMSSYRKGHLSWHPSASIFVGAGTTEREVLFTYHSNWDSAGRWGLELYTQKNKYILRPLEKLQIQKRDSVQIEFVTIEDDFDIKYKPGLFRQIEAFVAGSHPNLCSLQDHQRMFEHYYKIAGY